MLGFRLTKTFGPALKALGVVELVFCFSVMPGLDPAIHENTAVSSEASELTEV
jgi:hypothetical protein